MFGLHRRIILGEGRQEQGCWEPGSGGKVRWSILGNPIKPDHCRFWKEGLDPIPFR